MDPGLAAVAAWLRKRGKAVRPFLSKEQREHLRECFELIDTDGSGNLDAEELQAVFEALGDHVSLKETTEMIREVDRDGSMSIEFPEFVEIMTSTRDASEEAAPKVKDGSPKTQHIQLMASAYRRKKVMEGVILDQGNWRAKFVRVHEARIEEARQAEQARKARLLKRQDTLGFALKALGANKRRSSSGTHGSGVTCIPKLALRARVDSSSADGASLGDLTASSGRGSEPINTGDTPADTARSAWSLLGSPRDKHLATPTSRYSDSSASMSPRRVDLQSPADTPRGTATKTAASRWSLFKAKPQEPDKAAEQSAKALKVHRLRAAIRHKYESDAQEVAVSKLWLACRHESFTRKPRRLSHGTGDATGIRNAGTARHSSPGERTSMVTLSQAGPCADGLQVDADTQIPRIAQGVAGTELQAGSSAEPDHATAAQPHLRCRTRPDTQEPSSSAACWSHSHARAHVSADMDADLEAEQQHQHDLQQEGQQLLGIVPAIRHIKAVSNATAVVTPSYARPPDSSRLQWGDDDASLAQTLAISGHTTRKSVFHMLAGQAPVPGSARHDASGRSPFAATVRPSTAGPYMTLFRRPTASTHMLASAAKTLHSPRGVSTVSVAATMARSLKQTSKAAPPLVPLLTLPAGSVDDMLNGGSKAARSERRRALTERATAKPTALRQRIKLEAQEQVRAS